MTPEQEKDLIEIVHTLSISLRETIAMSAALGVVVVQGGIVSARQLYEISGGVAEKLKEEWPKMLEATREMNRPLSWPGTWSDICKESQDNLAAPGKAKAAD